MRECDFIQILPLLKSKQLRIIAISDSSLNNLHVDTVQAYTVLLVEDFDDAKPTHKPRGFSGGCVSPAESLEVHCTNQYTL